MYAQVRQSKEPITGWQGFFATRNHLFKNHAQSPLTAEQRCSFNQLLYYPYDSSLRVIGKVDYRVTQGVITIELAGNGLLHLRRIAAVHFELSGQSAQLSLFWVQGYGGGLFLPFTDQTNRTETFGGGRYLYDTIKGVDLGVDEHEILLDFNFAYNPSCAYNDRWVCPLAPQENDLNLAILAGEKRFMGSNGEP
jgi:uncharacterized protein (DUF1684 family)